MRKFGEITFTERGILVELPYENHQNFKKPNLEEAFKKAQLLVRGRLNECITTLQRNLVTSVARDANAVYYKDGTHFSAPAAECMQSILTKKDFDELTVPELVQVCKACVNPRSLTVDGKSEYLSSESIKIVNDISFEFLVAKTCNQ